MGALLAIVSAALFGANGSLTKVIVEAGVTPAVVTLFRTLGMTIFAGIALLATDRRAFRMSWRRLLSLALLGVVGIALLQSTYATVISLLPVGIALLLEYLAVVLVAIYALVVLRERVRPRIWLAIGLVLVGLGVVARVWDSALDPVGVAWGLIAALCLAFYFVFGERQTRVTSPLAVTFWGSLFATAFWACFSGWWGMRAGTLTASVSLGGRLADVHLPLWLLVLATMVLGSFVPFLLSFAAIRRLGPTAAGIIASSEVIFAFIAAWLWLGEELDAVQLIGGACVLAGIVLAQTSRRAAAQNGNLPLQV